MNNAVNTYNAARECSGTNCNGQACSTGYYLVFATSSQLPSIGTDIDIKMNNEDGFLAGCDTNNNPGSSTRTNTIDLHYRYPLFIDGLNSNDMENAINHEIAHLLGLDNTAYSDLTCDTVMRRANSVGKPYGALTCKDIERINEHFASRSNCTGNANNVRGLDPEATPTPTPTPTPEECIGLGYPCDGSVECCDPTENWCNGYTGACDNCPGQLYNGICTETPVVIDVLGNDFKLTDLTGGVFFDLNNDGTAELVSWTDRASDDVWLVLDRNANGTIDDGSEMFGSRTPQPKPPPGQRKQGFLALAEFDKLENGGNSDGMISPLDAVYASLRAWRDANHNGISEPAELLTLPQINISSLELKYKESGRVDAYGNRFRYRAKASGRWAYDVILLQSYTR